MTKTQDIDPDLLDDSPFQHRRKYTHIDELAASMKENGVLQTLLVRPKPSGKRYELVAGHRRKRAAKKAGLKTVPCIVRTMSDAEVQQAILVENAQRENIPPLEELKTYQELRAGGMEVEEIATRIGRPAGHVYRRLQLANLGKEAKKALANGSLTLVVAEMIGRIKDKELQQRAVERLAGDEFRSPATATQAQSWIERAATLLLKGAPFDPDDAELVEKAGACSTCPKNTAVATMLFPEMEEARCTDFKCFERKLDAAWERRKKRELERGRQVVEDEEGVSKFMSNYGGVKRTFMDLDSTLWTDDGKSKKVRTAIGPQRLSKIPITVLRHPRSGSVYEIVRAKDVRSVCKLEPKKDDPHEFKSQSSTQDARAKRESLVHREKADLLALRIMQAVAAEGQLPEGLELWRMLAHGASEHGSSEAVRRSLKRRRVEIAKTKWETDDIRGTAEKWIEGEVQGIRPWLVKIDQETRKETVPDPMPAALVDLQAFTIEVMFEPLLSHWGNTPWALERASLLLGFDLKEIADTAKNEVRLREKAKVDKKKAAAKRKEERMKKMLADFPELGVVCPVCAADIGKRCKSVPGHAIDKKLKQSHAARFDLGGVPKPPPIEPSPASKGKTKEPRLGAKAKRAKNGKKKTTKKKNAADDPKALLALHEGGMSYADIAKETGLSKDQVARRVRGARKS